MNAEDTAQRLSQEQFAFNPGADTLFRGLCKEDKTPQVQLSPIWGELPIVATTTVQHRGGSRLQLSWNRHKIGLDFIDNPCYRKVLKKHFPISLSAQLSVGQTSL